jgi:hypothetical protein
MRFLVLALFVAGCQCKKAPEPAELPETVLLPIPDRPWAEGAPDEGWCGETSIQMIGLHYGAWFPQPVINQLGRSTHVDLWESDIPTALSAVGLRYVTSTAATREEFITWIKSHLRQGHPVIVGAKLYPTAHPDWDVDHLMPVVGFSAVGLTFNTNLEAGQLEVPYAALGATKEGISFVSPSGKLFGYAVLGFEHDAPRASLRVLKESKDSLQLAVEAEGPSWIVERIELDGGVRSAPLTDVIEVNPGEPVRVRLRASAR